MKNSKRYEVFISSTFIDLKEERVEIIEALINLKQIPVGMELFNASDDTQWGVIKRRIDQSDYYVLIISDRYGSVDEKNISYTEKEFNYACEVGKPILAFVRDDASIAKLPDKYRETDNPKKLRDFRNRLMNNKHVKFWSDKHDLSKKFFLSFNEIIQESPQTGWIKADSFTPDHIKVLEDLSKANSDLNLLKSAFDKQRINSPLEVYNDFDHAWLDIEPLLKKLLLEQRHHNEKIKIRAMGLCLHKSFPKLSQFLMTQNIENVRIEIRLMTLDPTCNAWKSLNRRWPTLLETFRSDLDDFIDTLTDRYKKNLNSEDGNLDISIKHCTYTHMPNFHGVMINGEDLFLSSCMWDSKEKLSAGQNVYEHFQKGYSDFHDHKLRLYRRWFDYGRFNGSTERGKEKLLELKEHNKHFHE